MSEAIVIVIVSLVLSAFFSGMEMAFTNANRLQLEIERKQKSLSGRLLGFFVRHSEQYITTMLVGNNVVLVIYSLWMSIIVRGVFNIEGNILLETLVSTIVIIFTAEYIPKAIAKVNPVGYLKAMALPLVLFYVIFYPVAKLSTLISVGILHLFGIKASGGIAQKDFNKLDLENLIEEHTSEQNEPDNEIRIFQNVLDFSDLRVRDCMVQRVDVEAIDVESDIAELLEKFTKTQYSRIFVWEGSIDNIVGYVNIKSLFTNPQSIGEVVRKIRCVPETMMAQKLLGEFTKNHESVAVVIDEFGGTAGIVSLEDVLEEIFGEIDDEHDTPEMIEKRVGEDMWILSCRLEVDYLNDKYGFDIPLSPQYDTLAGYIIANNDGIPHRGEILNIADKEFRILRATSSRLELVQVRIK